MIDVIAEWMAGELYTLNLEVAEAVSGIMNDGIIDPEPFMWAFPSLVGGSAVTYPQMSYIVWIDKVCRN